MVWLQTWSKLRTQTMKLWVLSMGVTASGLQHQPCHPFLFCHSQNIHMPILPLRCLWYPKGPFPFFVGSHIRAQLCSLPEFWITLSQIFSLLTLLILLWSVYPLLPVLLCQLLLYLSCQFWIAQGLTLEASSLSVLPVCPEVIPCLTCLLYNNSQMYIYNAPLYLEIHFPGW